MAVDLNAFICKRPFFEKKRESFANTMFIFHGPHVKQQLLFMKIQSLPAKSHQIITDNFFIAL